MVIIIRDQDPHGIHLILNRDVCLFKKKKAAENKQQIEKIPGIIKCFICNSLCALKLKC